MYISIVATLSRPEGIALVFDNIEKTMKQSPEHTYEIILAIDNKKIKVLTYVWARLADIGANIKNMSTFNTKNEPPRKFNMDERRTRIAKLREMSKEYIGGSDFVFSFEDDTTLPHSALALLLDAYEELPNPGFIQGAQIGRWGNRYIGAWRVDDINNPKEYRTIYHDFAYGPEGPGIEEIDAGGFFCYITPTKLYKEASYKWQEPCGPDVDYGLQLRRLGYNNYIDWSVQCGHKTEKETLECHAPVVEIVLTPKGTRWQSKIIDRITLDANNDSQS